MSDTTPRASGADTNGTTPPGTTSKSSTTTASTQSGTGSHGLSPKILIALIAAISVVIIIAFILAVLLVCMRRRHHRGTAAAGPLKNPRAAAKNEDAGWARKNEQQRAVADGDLAVVPARHPETPALVPNRHSTFDASGSTPFSPGTSLRSPQSDSDEGTRPLLDHLMTDSRTTGTVTEETLSPPEVSPVQHGSGSWSEVGSEPQAQGDTLDTGHTGGFGSGALDQSAPEHGATAHAHTDRNIRDDEKKATILDDDGLEGTSRASLPETPAPLLPPSAPTAENAASPARFSSGPRGPRFVTVLMEVKEDNLEEQEQPPPYQPRSHSRAQEFGSFPASVVGVVEGSD